jgi:hypothetical protein
MKRVSRVLLVLALTSVMVVAGATPASAEKGGTARPLTATSTLSGTVNLLTGVVVLDGGGNTSHLGRVTTHVENGVSVTTAANGDTLSAIDGAQLDSSGVVCPTGWFAQVAESSIIGGTGRLSGATGTDVITSCILVGGGFPVAALTVNSTVEGTISY